MRHALLFALFLSVTLCALVPVSATASGSICGGGMVSHDAAPPALTGAPCPAPVVTGGPALPGLRPVPRGAMAAPPAPSGTLAAPAPVRAGHRVDALSLPRLN